MMKMLQCKLEVVFMKHRSLKRIGLMWANVFLGGISSVQFLLNSISVRYVLYNIARIAITKMLLHV